MKVAAVITNLSILLLFVVAALLNEYSEALFYLSVQEDELLEWATFWGFMVAAAIYFSSAYRQFKVEQFKFGLQMPWFVFGLGLFCFLVAMEEISWGQRILGYRAPDYFLEQNFQQELNLHNIIDTSFRKLVMKIILLGYGVVLSVASLWKPIENILTRLGIVAPSPVLIISFLAMYLMYSWYPWSHTGEWVEDAVITLVSTSVDGTMNEVGEFGDLAVGQSVEVFGDFGIGGCFQADEVVVDLTD